MTDKEAADILRGAGTEDGTTQEEFLQALKLGAKALEREQAWAQREVLRPSEVSAMVKRLQEERETALKEISRLRADILWISQSVHQAHHEGTLQECTKATCKRAWHDAYGEQS